jgi:hypothetical protein
VTASPVAVQQLDHEHPHYLRAVLIDKIAPYIYWQNGAFSSANSPINLCLVESGRDTIAQIWPYFSMLTEQYAEGRSYTVLDISEWGSDIDKLPLNCHIFYFANLEPHHTQLLINKAKQASILTLTDSLEELEQGAMMAFIEERGKIKIYVNTQSINDSRLKIKSSLLRIAKKI